MFYKSLFRLAHWAPLLCISLYLDPLKRLRVNFTKKIAFINISSIYPQVLESKMSHIFGKDYCERIWLRPHSAAGIPDTNISTPGKSRDDMSFYKIKCMHVPEKKCKGDINLRSFA